MKRTRSEERFVYILQEQPADFGRGFLLEKSEGERYAVNLAGQQSTCDCKGFSSHNHCKHVESLLALEKAEKL